MLKKLLFSLVPLTLLFHANFAQQLALDVFAGTSNYQGDIVEKVYTMENSKLALGLGVSYIFNEHFRVRGMVSIGRVTADDKDNNDPSLLARNLNFFSNITEFAVTAHYDFFDINSYKFTPYVFAGLGVFRFNPYTFDSAVAGKIFLKPLSTEGQGLSQYPDRKPYSLTQLNFPFGAGIKFRVNEDISVAWEIGLRKTFTDYLDDLSTNYIDQAILLAERGPTAVAVSFRGDELKDNPMPYPQAGVKRGGPTEKDWYYFSGITATFRLRAGPAFSGDKRGSTDCPRKF